MWYGTEFSGVHIPPKLMLIHVHILHFRFQDIQPFFPLRTTDDLTNARKQDIHSRNGFIIIVQAHIESLDLLWIIEKNHRAFKMFFHQEALMLALQVNSPTV